MTPFRPLLFIPVLLGCMAAPCAHAQLATLRGRVTDAADGQPLPGVNVVLRSEDGDQTGTATGGDGVFILARILPGRYALTVSFIGYAPFTDTLTVAFGQQLTRQVALEATEAALDELVVEAERKAGDNRIAGLETVRPTALVQVPLPDVSADLAGYLLTRPGVVTTGDRGGQLFVRGGTPTQNLVLVDGMPLYQPFHIVGFYSAFPADIISYADVYAGGFGARYGGRLSSVVDVATRNGNKQRLSAAASLAPFLSAVRVEVPFVREAVSILASVRESVIERIAPQVLQEELPYRFGDRFAKLHAFLSQTSSVSLTALQTFDEGNVANVEGLGERISWENLAFGGRYLYLPTDMPVLAELALFTSRYDSEYGPGEDPARTASASGFNAEINFSYLLGDTQIRFGLFGRSNRFQYNLNRQVEREDFREFVSEGGGYLEGKFRLLPGLRFEPGLRLHSFPSRAQMALEPRLRGVWQPGGAQARQQFSAAWGLYHQQIVGVSNGRDATDVFVAWAPSPPQRRVPQAMHFIAGWQRRLGAGVDLAVEGYHKVLRHLAVPLFTEVLEDAVVFEPADGQAWGLDLRLELSRPSFYGYVGYGLASVVYQTTGETGAPLRFHPPHDRRHQLNVLGRFVRGPYAVSVRWQFGSGFPFTQVNGFYEVVPVRVAGDAYHTDPGTPFVSYAEPYGGRLPAYHRLDVSAERTFTFSKMRATLLAALINTYNRANIFDYDLFTGQRIDQLPLIPSVGLKVELN